LDSSMPFFIPFDIANEVNDRLMDEFEKEPVIYGFSGPANLILDTLKDLENHLGSELGAEDPITHERMPYIHIQEIEKIIDYPGVKFTVNLIVFKAFDIIIFVVPEIIFEFLYEVRNKFGNIDPIQYKFFLVFKKHFFIWGIETPKVYMEKGKLVQDIEMVQAVFKDYFFTTKILSEVMQEKGQGGI